MTQYFDALHAQLDAISVWRSPIGLLVADNISKQMMKARRAAPKPMDLLRQCEDLLCRAEPYYLDGRIEQWLIESRMSLPRAISIGNVMPPSPFGWLLFAEPIFTVAEVWGNYDGGTIGFAWSTMDEMHWVKPNSHVPGVSLDYYGRHRGVIILASSQWWPLDESLADWDKASPPVVHAALNTMHELVFGVFAFMQQPFICLVQRAIPRQQSRFFERRHQTTAPQVRVITLRRAVQADRDNHEHRDVPWSCQWVVRGHWRSQYYSKERLHKPKWIMPYVKGPEDKPFKPCRINLFNIVR